MKIFIKQNQKKKEKERKKEKVMRGEETRETKKRTKQIHR